MELNKDLQANPILPPGIQRPQTGPEKPKTMAQKMIEEDVTSAILKNMRNKKQERVSKNVANEVKQSVTEIRNDFLSFLAKVYNKDTRREGVQGCHKLIQANNDNLEALKIFLTALCDRSTMAA